MSVKLFCLTTLVALVIGQTAFAQTPIITPKTNIVLKLDNTGNHTVSLAEVATALNPDGTAPSQVTVNPASFNCSKLGAQTVTVTATNYVGPVVTGSATKTINVTVASQPQFPAHADVAVGSNANCSGTVPDFTANSGATSCPGANLTITQSPVAGTSMVIGTPTTITLTATDQYGGSATTTFKATYKYSPVISALPGPIKLTLDASGNYQTKVNDVASIVTCDNSNPTVTLNPIAFTCAQLGPQTVTVTATTITPSTPTAVSFRQPEGLSMDAAGNIYVADGGNFAIRKITPAGVVTSIAGGTRGHLDAPGPNAQFNYPTGVAVDAAGNLFITDITNSLIRKIATDGTVSTFAGGGSGVNGPDGVGTAASFNYPIALAFDSQGNLFVLDGGNSLIRKITPAGAVTTFAGQTGVNSYIDGTGVNATFMGLDGLFIDASDNIYVADQNKVRKVTPAAVVTTIAGDVNEGFVDGASTVAKFFLTCDIVTDAAGNIYVADYFNHRIRKITPAGVVSTFAGSGVAGSANGTGTAATLNGPRSMVIDAAGNIYVSELLNHDIRKITPEGVVTTYAGSTTPGFTDGNVGGEVTSTASKTINVMVASIPVFAAHADVTIATDANCKSVVPDFTVNPAITACPTANLTFTQVPAAGTPLVVNTLTTITLTATDQYGSQGTISFKVIARAKPVITPLAQPITIKLDANGNYAAKLTDLATVTMCDNNTPAITINPINIDCSKLGPQVFTITALNGLNTTDPAITTTTAQVNVNVVSTVKINTNFADVSIAVSASCPTLMPDYANGASATSSCGNNIVFTQSPAAGTPITGTNPITVTITATDNAGTAGTTSFKVTPNSTPAAAPSVSIAATSQNICDGTMVTFTATPANTPGIPTYQWLLNGNNTGPNSTTYATATLKDGDIVSCKMIIATGCTVSVTSNALPVKVSSNLTVAVSINAPALDICAGQSFTFTASPTNPGSNPTFKWLVNGAPAGSNSATFITSTLTNNDQVTCSLTNNDAGCFTAKTATSLPLLIKVSPVITPTVSITSSVNNTVCAGTAISFTANTYVVAPAYQWQVNGIDAGTNSFTFSSTTLKDGDAVTCTITAAEKCATLKTVTSNKIIVSIINSFTLTPIISTPDVNICKGQPVTFTLSGAVGPANANLSYKWLVNDIAVNGGSSTAYTSSTLKDADVVTCQISSGSGCAGPFKSNSLTVHLPSVTFSVTPPTIKKGESFTLTPIITGNIASYQWSPAAGLSDATIANPVATPDFTTRYQLTVISVSGCVATASVTIPVIVPLDIPNSFTPNGDGINDLWRISALGNYPKNTVDIFDRYGRILFHSTGYSKPWDGTQNGNTLPAGVYYYVIDPKNSAFKPQSGWVAIIR